MSKILFHKKTDEKVDEIKSSVETFLAEVSNSDRQLFSYDEVQNMLLDIYSLVSKQ